MYVSTLVSDLNYWQHQKNGPKQYRVYYEDGSFDRINFNQNVDLTDYPIGSAVGYVFKHENEDDMYGGRVYGPEGMFYLRSQKNYKEVEAELFSRLSEAKAEFCRINSDLFYHFERELKRHDWTYAYSDDHNVWRRGESHFDLIKKLMKKCESIDSKRTTELYDKYKKFLT